MAMNDQLSIKLLHLLVSCAAMFMLPAANAQTASFKWARLLTGFTNEDNIRRAVLDADGNVIAAYYRADAVQPGPWRSNLVMKIDTRAGDVLWSHRQLPFTRSLGTAHDGTVYVAGSLAYINDNGGASLGGAQNYFSARGIPTEGIGGGYLAKLSPATGAIESIRHFGTSLYVMPNHLAVTAEGDVVLAGLYMRTAAQFGDITLPAPSTSTTRNLFLVKLGPSGEVRWAKAFPSTQIFTFMNGMDMDGMGHVILSGFTVAQTSVDQTFIAKFTPDGTQLWIKNGLYGFPRIDQAGNIFVAGSADGGSVLQKYNPDGGQLWTIPVPMLAHGAVDVTGKYIGVGSFRIQGNDPNDFNSISTTKLKVGDNILQTDAEVEMYAAQYSSSGDLGWVAQTQGQDFAYRPWPDGTFAGAGYIASWTSPNFVFAHPERGILIGGTVRGRTLFGDTLLEGDYKKDFQPETSFFIASIAEPVSEVVSLNVARTDSGLALSWPSTAPGLILESTDAVPASAWSAVPTVPVLEAGQNVVTIETGGAARFYRLRKQ